MDFIISFATVFLIARFMKTLFPNFLEINPMQLFNFDIMAIMFIVNALIFASMLYIFFAIVNIFKKIRYFNLFFYQAIKAYSILNVLTVILFVILIDKVMKNKLNEWNAIESAISITSLILVFYLFYRLLMKPIAEYLINTNVFKKKTAYLFGILSIIIVMQTNQPVFSNYFINVIDKQELCKQYVEINYKDNITNMKQDKDCMIGKCIKLIENGDIP